MRAISDWVVRTSQSLPLFALASLLGPLTLIFVLMPLMRAFTDISGGVPPFDWQEDLTAAAIQAQVPAYTDVMRNIYYAHTFVDFLFPAFFGVFIGAIPAYFLRHGLPAVHEAAARYGLYALFIATALFDMLENIGALGVLLIAGGTGGAWTGVLLFGKQLKLIVQQLVPPLALAGILAGAGGWAWTWLRR